MRTKVVFFFVDDAVGVARVFGGFLLHHQGVWRKLVLLQYLKVSQDLFNLLLGLLFILSFHLLFLIVFFFLFFLFVFHESRWRGISDFFTGIGSGPNSWYLKGVLWCFIIWLPPLPFVVVVNVVVDDLHWPIDLIFADVVHVGDVFTVGIRWTILLTILIILGVAPPNFVVTIGSEQVLFLSRPSPFLLWLLLVVGIEVPYFVDHLLGDFVLSGSVLLWIIVGELQQFVF